MQSKSETIPSKNKAEQEALEVRENKARNRKKEPEVQCTIDWLNDVE